MSDVTFELPHAPVARLMKKSLTDKNIQVAKGVKSATAKSSGLFILYVMNVAQSYASDAGRQTVMAEDVLAALEELDFPDIYEQVEDYLATYRKKSGKEVKSRGTRKKGTANNKSKSKKKTATKKRKTPSKPRAEATEQPEQPAAAAAAPAPVEQQSAVEESTQSSPKKLKLTEE